MELQKRRRFIVCACLVLVAIATMIFLLSSCAPSGDIGGLLHYERIFIGEMPCVVVKGDNRLAPVEGIGISCYWEKCAEACEQAIQDWKIVEAE